MAQITALSTSDFIDSIGVNTHIMYTDGGYANYEAVISALKYLGIEHVRDTPQNLEDLGYGGWHYDPIAAAGIKFTFFFQSGAGWQTTLSRIDNFVTNHPGSVTMIEGSNEIDTWPVTYNGKTGLSAAVDLQSDIYAAIKADPLLAGVPVANLSLSTGWSGYVYQIGTMSGIVDYGNIHAYFEHGDQPWTMLAPVANAQSWMTPGRAMVISETGYHTAVGSASAPGVDEPTQAKLTLNLLFDAFKAGVKSTFLYQLLDAYSDPGGADQEKHFGLFDTSYRPKDAAVALHNLTTILTDNGGDPGANPGTLDLGISGLPAHGNSLLLQKAGGAFDLVVWAEPDIWNEVAKTAIQVQASPVTVSLGQTCASVTVFDPLVGEQPIATYRNVASIVVPVSDHPVVIEIVPAGTAPTPDPGGPTADDDTLSDGGIAALLAAGAGDDTYVVTVAGTRVHEVGGEGYDTVRSAVGHTLDDNVERLVLTGTAAIAGTGNALANVLQGNGAANLLDGNAGADAMLGAGGDDIYVVDDAGDSVVEDAGGGNDTVRSSVDWTLSDNVETLVLTGSAGRIGIGNGLDNTIVGTGGADQISGGAGNDRLEGRAGDDTYGVDSSGDVVVEESGGGYDTVRSSVSHLLSANVEALVLTGSGAINGTGNALANTITGNGAANRLDGGSGIDRLIGGLGDDSYVVDNRSDQVVEAAGGGYDTVFAKVSFNLSPETEALVFTGSGDLRGKGNGLANALTGNAGRNVLDGAAGNDVIEGAGGSDVLTGGAGQDTFVFRQGSGADIITDFQARSGSSHDVIRIVGDIDSFAELRWAARQIRSDVLLNLGHGDSILLKKVSFLALSADDFAFG